MDPPWASLNRIASVVDVPLPQLREIAATAGRFYKPYDLLLPGKKARHIDNPRGPLRQIQKLLARRVFRKMPMPSFMYGGIRGRSAIMMAKKHVGQPCVVAVDIRGCFPSTRPELIRTALAAHAGFGRQSASLVTKLTTLHHGLPQGASTSSYLLNLAVANLHATLHREALQRGLVYTVFVDDIVVSGQRPEPMIDLIADTLGSSGLQLSRKKKRIMRGSEREVLSVMLGPKLDAKPSFYERFDVGITRARATGVISEQQQQKLAGMANYVHMVNADQGEVLARVLKLLLDEVVVVPAPFLKAAREHQSCTHRRRHRRHVARL